MRLIIFGIILFFVTQVSAQTVIDITDAVEVESFKVSDIFHEGVQYSCVEVPDNECNQSSCSFELIMNDKIAVNCFMNSLLIYNDKGCFLKEFKNTGQFRTWDILQPNQKNGEIYESSFFDDGTTRKIINCLNGKELREIRIPQEYAGKISTFIECQDDIYGAYTNNQTGTDSTLFVFFNNKGRILNTVKNSRSYIDYVADIQVVDGSYYTFDDKIFFQEQEVGNTIYEIKDLNLIPHIVFDFGKKSYKYDLREMPDGNKGKYILGAVCETKLRVYFSIRLHNETKWGYYNKENKKTYLTSFNNAKRYSESNFIVGLQQACPKAIIMIGHEDNKYKLLIGKLI